MLGAIISILVVVLVALFACYIAKILCGMATGLPPQVLQIVCIIIVLIALAEVIHICVAGMSLHLMF